MRKIFISYARDDDELFVKRLYYELTAQDFVVWWDRISMPSRALSFLQEVREAVNQADRLVVVIGPKAVLSDYVRAEWQYALTQSKVVTPILRLGDYCILPPELRNLHCPDFRVDQSWDEAVADLSRILCEPIPPLGPLHGVVSPPPHFQPRPDDMARLAEIVLPDLKRPVVLTGAERITVLYGMGGVGKSVLAAAFARATETRRAFRDGVIWLNMGQQPELVPNLQEVGRALGEAPQQYTNAKSGTSRLAEVLSDKAFLIVLDDVWEVGHAEPLLNAVGTRGRLLITTRDGGLSTALGAREQRLDVLTEDAALRHLADWSEQPMDALTPEASALADECGNLPFALALCGAMARDGIPWGDLLDALHNTDLTFIAKQFPNYPYPNVMRSLKVSVDVLAHTDPVGARYYQELAVFPMGTAVPETAVMTLWLHTNGLDEKRARKLLTTLDRKALLRLEGNVPHRLVSLHQLQHDYLRSSLSEYAALHNKLLQAYRDKCPNDWPSGPNDGYFFEFLTYHLSEAGRADEIHRLLAIETPEKRNAWYEAREALGEVAGYLADVSRAWRLTDEQIAVEDSEWSVAIGQQCRYALIVSSINIMAKMIPLSLLPGLLKEDIWTPAQALAYALQMADPEQRAKILTMLAPNLSETLMVEALTAARAIKHQLWRAVTLTNLIDHLTEHLKEEVLREAMVAARVIEDEKDRATALSGLGIHPELPDAERKKILLEALEVARKIKDAKDRAWSLAAVPAQALPVTEQEQVLREALMTARAIRDARDRAWVLGWLASHPQMPEVECEGVLQEALGAARSIKIAHVRAEILAGLARQLPEPEQKQVVLEALAAAQGRIRRTWPFRGWRKRHAESEKELEERVGVLAALVPQLATSGSINEALATMQALPQDEYLGLGLRAQALAGLVPHLPEAMRKVAVRDGLAAARAIKLLTIAPRILADLARYLPDAKREQTLREALEKARELPVGDLEVQTPIAALMSRSRAEVLVDLIPYLPETDRREVLREALTASQAIRDHEHQARSLVGLSPNLPEALVLEALVATRAIKNKDERVRKLVSLAPYLPGQKAGQALQEALAAAREIENEGKRAWVLARLAPYLPEEVREQAMEESHEAWQKAEILWQQGSKEGFIRGAESETYRTRMLLEHALSIPVQGQEEAAKEAVTAIVALAVREVGQPKHVGTMDYLERSMVKELPTDSMIRIVSQLPDQHQEHVLRMALVSTREIAENFRAEVLMELAPHLPASLLPEALARAREIEREDESAWVQARLVSQLPDHEQQQILQEALAAAQAIEKDYWRAEALAWLVPSLPRPFNESTLQEILGAVRMIEERPTRIKLNREIREREVFLDDPKRRKAYGRLLPQLTRLGFSQEALTVAQGIENDYDRAWVLEQLSPCLAELPPTTLYPLWQETLPILAARTRRDLLSDLRPLGAVIASLGGELAAAETFRAIQDVGRWWP